jgi:hypothetical protein
MKNIAKEKRETFKLMPSKKSLKVFLNERLFSGKVKRIATYNKDCIIFHVKITDTKKFYATPSFCEVQGIMNNEITYTIPNNIHGFKSIIDEINYFRKFPESAKNRLNSNGNFNYTII